ncbi:hypothetical protein [Cryptosporangium sp. NPDC051539]|uniref:hypothetical protein n=1 Tax=Cryptosporangium sp. NPDC051539 TaxID=3363962 RepID=UPI0037AC4C30
MRHYRPGLAALRAAPPDLGDLPVTTLSAGGGISAGKGISAGAARRSRPTAHPATAGRLVVAEGAGHNLMFERPGLVVDEILRRL